MKYILLYTLIALQTLTIVLTAVTLKEVREVKQPQCGDFQYYDAEFDKCMTFRNYEQELAITE